MKVSFERVLSFLFRLRPQKNQPHLLGASGLSFPEADGPTSSSFSPPLFPRAPPPFPFAAALAPLTTFSCATFPPPDFIALSNLSAALLASARRWSYISSNDSKLPLSWVVVVEVFGVGFGRIEDEKKRARKKDEIL